MSAPRNQPAVSASSREAMDAALEHLARSRGSWVALDVTDKVRILDLLLRNLHAVRADWANASADAKGVDRGSTAAGEEWATFSCLLRAVTILRASLSAVARGGRPPIPGPILPCGKDQVSGRGFPQRI